MSPGSTEKSAVILYFFSLGDFSVSFDSLVLGNFVIHLGVVSLVVLVLRGGRAATIGRFTVSIKFGNF